MSEDRKVHDEVREQTVGYIATALGLVAGLAWNEAIKAAIDIWLPIGSGSGLWAKFIYAAVVTVLVVFATRSLLKIARKN